MATTPSGAVDDEPSVAEAAAEGAGCEVSEGDATWLVAVAASAVAAWELEVAGSADCGADGLFFAFPEPAAF